MDLLLLPFKFMAVAWLENNLNPNYRRDHDSGVCESLSFLINTLKSNSNFDSVDKKQAGENTFSLLETSDVWYAYIMTSQYTSL